MEESSTHYYRAIASSIRALAPELKSAEARASLLLLAADYERLADYVEAVAGVLESTVGAPDSEKVNRH